MRTRDVLGLAAALALLAPAPATAAPIGGLVVTPGESSGPVPVRLTTEKGCPLPANAYYATMSGPGLAEDLVIVANGDVGLSATAGFDLPVAFTFADFAKDNNVVFAGRYTITVHCVDGFSQQGYGEFTGQLDFTEPAAGSPPGAYVAAGRAKGPQRPTAPLVPTEEVVPPPSAGQPVPGAPEAPAPAPEATAATAPVADDGPTPLIYLALGVAAVVVAAVAGAAAVRRRTPRTEPADAE